MKLYFRLLFILLLILTSCNPQPQADKLLTMAQTLVDSNPDSAMQIIESIYYPEQSLSKRRYMEFLVTQVQTKHKLYHSIAEDTIVFKAKDYFSQHDKYPSQSALAWFYSGWVYREQNRPDEAMEHYQKAQGYANKTQDSELIALINYNIGDLLTLQGLYRESLEHYKETALLLDTNSEKHAAFDSEIGRLYLLLAQDDSAFYFLHKGLEKVREAKNKDFLVQFIQNLSLVHSNLSQYDESLELLREAYHLDQDEESIPMYYLNFANVFNKMHLTDSVFKYAQLLEQYDIDSIDDLYLQTSIYQFLAKYEKSRHNFDAAFEYQNERIYLIDEITTELLEQSVYEIQRKYDYERLKIKHQSKQNKYKLWIIILLITIILGITLFSWFTLRQKNRLIYVQQQLNTLKEISAELKNSNNDIDNTKDKDIRSLLLWKMNIIKKSAQLEEIAKNNRESKFLVNEFYKIIYGKGQADHWANVLAVFDQLNPNIIPKIKENFPTLNETDFKITVLTYAGMTAKEASIILDLSPNTVQTYRNRLRKKLNIEDASIDTFSFLKENLG